MAATPIDSVTPTGASIPRQLLHLLHLSSPALPIGAFAYSQGLESAIEEGWLNEVPRLQAWLEDLLALGLCRLDLPVMCRLMDALARDDQPQLAYWNQYLLASRETHELHQEDCQLGSALRRLLGSLQVTQPDAWQGTIRVSLISQYALACHHWQLTPQMAALGFMWSWLENQMAVAAKAVPLGQTHIQQLLLRMMPRVSELSDTALAVDDEGIGGSLPGQVWASCRHEQQYSRLFRS